MQNSVLPMCFSFLVIYINLNQRYIFTPIDLCHISLTQIRSSHPVRTNRMQTLTLAEQCIAWEPRSCESCWVRICMHRVQTKCILRIWYHNLACLPDKRVAERPDPLQQSVLHSSQPKAGLRPQSLCYAHLSKKLASDVNPFAMPISTWSSPPNLKTTLTNFISRRLKPSIHKYCIKA